MTVIQICNIFEEMLIQTTYRYILYFTCLYMVRFYEQVGVVNLLKQFQQTLLSGFLHVDFLSGLLALFMCV